MSGSFQTSTYALQAPGVAGDFASANPRATVLSSQIYNSTGFKAGTSGLTIGLFAWLDTSTYTFANNFGAGAPNGFVHRAAEALITTYLNAYGMTIPAGFMCGNIFDAGDFFVVNNGTTEATPGMKAYANNSTGVATFAAAGAPTASAVSAATASITAETASWTGTIVDNVMTVVSGLTGLAVVGATLSGTNVATGTIITSLATGTGGVGSTFLVSPRDQTVASTSISATYGLFAPGTLVSGAFAVGMTLTGSSTGVTAGTYITAASATAGDWIVTPNDTAGSQTITGYSNTETSWYCRSFGQPGDVVKISSRAMG
jgi:hypothetical protein